MEIRYYRLRKGLSQKELAKRVGITQQYMCCLEKGKKQNPSFPLLGKIADALDVPVSELIARKAG